MRLTKRDVCWSLILGIVVLCASSLVSAELLKKITVAYLAGAAGVMIVCGRKWGRTNVTRATSLMIWIFLPPVCILDRLQVSFAWSIAWAAAIGLSPALGYRLGRLLHRGGSRSGTGDDAELET